MDIQIQKPAGSPVERIMAVAADLFYTQGYRATGVNEVIEKSGVAKATFYSHFPSKDDLAVAYLERACEQDLVDLNRILATESDPFGRFLVPVAWVGSWLVEHEFRGCPFINMVSEVPDANDRIRKVGMKLYDQALELVTKLTEELIASDRKRYGHLDAREVSRQYVVIVAGAFALSGLHHKLWPAEHAVEAVRRLVGA